MYRLLTAKRLIIVIFIAFFQIPLIVIAAPTLQALTLQLDGVTRRIDLYVPVVKSELSGIPLVIVLHGGGGNGENAAKMTGFTAKAQQEGFMVAYPDGSGRFRNKLLTWNAGHCCGYAMKNNIDDVGFIRALIDQLVTDYNADPRRVYVTGMSNGGMMTHRIGIELSTKITAIAPVVATLFGDEPKPAVAVPALFINGALDKSVPINGGLSGGHAADAWDGTPSKPGIYQSTFWVKANACQPEPRITKQIVAKAEITQWRYACPDGQDVIRYVISDNGHAWPGGEKGSRRGDTPSEAMNATNVIWDFFKSHSR